MATTEGKSLSDSHKGTGGGCSSQGTSKRRRTSPHLKSLSVPGVNPSTTSGVQAHGSSSGPANTAAIHPPTHQSGVAVPSGAASAPSGAQGFAPTALAQCDPATAATLAQLMNPHAAAAHAAQAAVAGYAAMAAAAQHIVQQQAQAQAQAHQVVQQMNLQHPPNFFGPQSATQLTGNGNTSDAAVTTNNEAGAVAAQRTRPSERSTSGSEASTKGNNDRETGTPQPSPPETQIQQQQKQPQPHAPQRPVPLPSHPPCATHSAHSPFLPGPQHVATMGAPPQPMMIPPFPPLHNIVPHQPSGMHLSPAGNGNGGGGGFHHAGPQHAIMFQPPSGMPDDLEKWNKEQLEGYVRFLQENNQPVPQPISSLLAEVRRKEEKKAAKRIANRKSASTSRARKKALVEEMERTNARLRRQALILALLPDLVMAISVDGTITFCSAQVERVLRHKCEDLVGANFEDLLAPASREAVRRLIEKLVEMDAGGGPGSNGGDGGSERKGACEGDGGVGSNNGLVAENGNSLSSGAGGDLSSNTTGAAAVVSDQSLMQSDKPFPLSVVNVTSKRHRRESVAGGEPGQVTGGSSATNDSPGEPGDEEKAQSSSVNTSLSRSDSNNPSSSDDSGVEAGSNDVNNDINGNGKPLKMKKKTSSSSQDQQPPKKKAKFQPRPSSSSDESSADARAREALNRNVQSCNEKLRHELENLRKEKGAKTVVHTDDVTGASVTANNAEARLSSLQHRPGKMKADVDVDVDAEGGSNSLPHRDKKELKGGGGKSSSRESGIRSSSSLTFESLMKHSSSCMSSDSFSSRPRTKKSSGCTGSSLATNCVAARDRNRDGDNENENSSEDSGYREGSDSFPSREDSASSTDDSSNNNCKIARRPRPLAPACNVCLIRDDLTTIWCEVTSSIRTRPSNDNPGEGEPSATTDQSSTETSSNKQSAPLAVGASSAAMADSKSSGGNGNKPLSKGNELDVSSPTEKKHLVKELLLCLRPIRDGQEKVADELRFRPKKNQEATNNDGILPEDRDRSENKPTTITGSSESRASGDCDSNQALTSSSSCGERKPPPKKRNVEHGVTGNEMIGNPLSKKAKVVCQSSSHGQTESTSSASASAESERSVVESLMLMSNR